MAIPASTIVQITPRVLSGTGTDLTFNGLFLSQSERLPNGQLTSFNSASSVGDFFGTDSTEYSAASSYFSGFDNSDVKPRALYFYRFNSEARPAFVRSAAFEETQAQLLAELANIIDGTFTATVNGHTATINNINFNGITSLSQAASILQGAIRTRNNVEDLAASNTYATAKETGPSGNELSIIIANGSPQVTQEATKASSEIGTAVTAGVAGNNISVAVTMQTQTITPAVAATSAIGTAVTAGTAGNNITVEVTEDTETVTPATAASCKYGTAKTAGASGNNLKVIITANQTTPANFDVKINNGSSDVFTQEDVTAGSTTANLNENEYITWAESEALTVEEVQLSGGQDLASKTVYNVVTKLSGSDQDTQSDLETPSELTDNALVTFNKEGSFTAQTYTFTGGKDAETRDDYTVVTRNASQDVDTQTVTAYDQLTGNAFVNFDKSSFELAVNTYQFTGGQDEILTPTFDVSTARNGIAFDSQNVNKASDLTDNEAVTFTRTATLIAGEYPLSGGADLGQTAWANATVEFSSNLEAFTVTLGEDGAAISITNCTGTVAEAMYLTPEQGATYSEGADSMSLTNTLEAAIEQGRNYVTIGTIFDLNDEQIIEIAQWVSTQYNEGEQFLFVFHTQDVNLTNVAYQGETIASQLTELNVNGTCGIYGDVRYSAFMMGVIASINWDGDNSTITLAFKSQSGLPASVTTRAAFSGLKANSINFIGNFASRNDEFILSYPGSLFGQWRWIDSYLGSIWLSNALQVQILAGLQTAKRVPYSSAGYALIRAWCTDVIERGITNGVITRNVNLSATQRSQLQQDAGINIGDEVYNNGYYLKISDTTAQVRQERESPTLGLWYTDAGAVHSISMPVTTVQ